MYSENNSKIEITNSKIEITNSKIINFYNSHPNVDIEEINLYMINIILSNEKKDLPNFTSSPVPPYDHFDKITKKPPSHIVNILSNIFPTADIKPNEDIIYINRIKKTKILVKNMDIESNVSNDDVCFFNEFIDKENCCGIILSQHSGISNKNHYQIDICNNNIIVYIHNVNYSECIISTAIDIIDNLYDKIQEFSKKYGENFTIPKELLDNINNEYQSFMNQKTLIVNTVKEYQKKLLSQLDECKFSSLGLFLSQNYYTSIQKSSFNCQLCNNYFANNLKALAAHKRGCARKHRTITM
jgi:hypothetical protein